MLKQFFSSLLFIGTSLFYSKLIAATALVAEPVVFTHDAFPVRYKIAAALIEPLDFFVARRAHELYNKINGSADFKVISAVDKMPKINSTLWETMCSFEKLDAFEGAEVFATTFVIKSGVKPSIALWDFLDKGGTVDCLIVLDLVLQIINMEMLGTSRYDASWSGEGLALPSRSLIGVCKGTDHLPRRRGEFGYIANVQSYNVMHPGGLATGQNVFCVGLSPAREPLYVGFGAFFAEPRTELEVIEILYHDTIIAIDESVKIPLVTLLEREAMRKKYADAKLLWEDERRLQQGKFWGFKFST